jgi:hypothetical protein
MSSQVALGCLINAAWLSSSAARPRVGAHPVKRHVSRARPLPALAKASHCTFWPPRRLLGSE